MLSGHCTEALSTQANVTISGSSAKLIKNDIAPLPFPLPALLKQYWHIKRGEGQGEGTCSMLCNARVYSVQFKFLEPVDILVERFLVFLFEQEVLQEQEVHVGPHEAEVGLFRRAHDRFAAHVE